MTNTDRLDDIYPNFGHRSEYICRLRAENEKLRTERDEARREACFRENELRGYSVLPMSAQDYAKELGWDCFKKETPWSMINFMRDECGHEFDVIRDNLWFKELSTIHELKMKETP